MTTRSNYLKLPILPLLCALCRRSAEGGWQEIQNKPKYPHFQSNIKGRQKSKRSADPELASGNKAKIQNKPKLRNEAKLQSGLGKNTKQSQFRLPDQKKRN